MYPNPVRDVLNIESPAAILTISVQDMNGKQLISLSGTGNAIDVSHLPQGVYIVKVTTETETITKKITKQ